MISGGNCVVLSVSARISLLYSAGDDVEENTPYQIRIILPLILFKSLQIQLAIRYFNRTLNDLSYWRININIRSFQTDH